MAATPPELIIVYNADGDLVSAVVDAVRKVVSPASYECSLCQITHGALTMRGHWREFLAHLPNPVRTFHRDDFLKAYPGFAIRFPALLIRRDGGSPEVLVGADEFATMEGVDELIGVTARRLETVETE